RARTHLDAGARRDELATARPRQRGVESTASRKSASNLGSWEQTTAIGRDGKQTTQLDVAFDFSAALRGT
ncbi:unnamed protein product, partial [Ixodes persulcatus]